MLRYRKLETTLPYYRRLWTQGSLETGDVLQETVGDMEDMLPEAARDQNCNAERRRVVDIC